MLKGYKCKVKYGRNVGRKVKLRVKTRIELVIENNNGGLGNSKRNIFIGICSNFNHIFIKINFSTVTYNNKIQYILYIKSIKYHDANNIKNNF